MASQKLSQPWGFHHFQKIIKANSNFPKSDQGQRSQQEYSIPRVIVMRNEKRSVCCLLAFSLFAQP